MANTEIARRWLASIAESKEISEIPSTIILPRELMTRLKEMQLNRSQIKGGREKYFFLLHSNGNSTLRFSKVSLSPLPGISPFQLSDEFFSRRPIGTVHSHPDKTIHSSPDLEMLYSSRAPISIVVTSTGEIFMITKVFVTPERLDTSDLPEFTSMVVYKIVNLLFEILYTRNPERDPFRDALNASLLKISGNLILTPLNLVTRLVNTLRAGPMKEEFHRKYNAWVLAWCKAANMVVYRGSLENSTLRKII